MEWSDLSVGEPAAVTEPRAERRPGRHRALRAGRDAHREAAAIPTPKEAATMPSCREAAES